MKSRQGKTLDQKTLDTLLRLVPKITKLIERVQVLESTLAQLGQDCSCAVRAREHRARLDAERERAEVHERREAKIRQHVEREQKRDPVLVVSIPPNSSSARSALREFELGEAAGFYNGTIIRPEVYMRRSEWLRLATQYSDEVAWLKFEGLSAESCNDWNTISAVIGTPIELAAS